MGFSRREYWRGLPSLPPGETTKPRGQVKEQSWIYALCYRQDAAGSLFIKWKILYLEYFYSVKFYIS